jgi:hypothetical protein
VAAAGEDGDFCPWKMAADDVVVVLADEVGLGAHQEQSPTRELIIGLERGGTHAWQLGLERLKPDRPGKTAAGIVGQIGQEERPQLSVRDFRPEALVRFPA